MNFSKPFLLPMILGLITMPAVAQVYKWIDEKGNTQYSDRAPSSSKSKIETVKVAPPAQSGQQTPSWEEKDRDFRRRQIEQSAVQTDDDSAPTSRQICANARNRLQFLDGKLVYRLDKHGQRIYMEEAERAAIEKQAKQDIAKHCQR